MYLARLPNVASRCGRSQWTSRIVARSFSRTPVFCKDEHNKHPDEPAPLPIENPISRTFRLLKNDMGTVKNFFVSPKNATYEKPVEQLDIRDFANKQTETTEFQSHCDVLIIGGGGIGSSIAYWLKKRAFSGLNVVVLEKDPTVFIIIVTIFYFFVVNSEFFSSTKEHQQPYLSVASASSSRSKRTSR